MKISKDAVTKELNRRKLLTEASKAFILEDYLFEQQLNFVRDTSPNKVAVCSRRSGKTVACAADLIHTAITNSSVVCLYITLSRNNAKKIIWSELKKINRIHKLNGKLNVVELSIAFPNGSVIYCSGAKDASEIEKFRGMALKLCYIDESQSFRAFIKELIDDVLSPALMDHAGSLCLIGTPGPVPTGYFYDCAESSNSWSKHHWTFLNNPFLTEKSKLTHQQLLDRELARRGVASNDPSIQREWFGKWVLDDDSLLLHYNPQLNDYQALPALPGPSKWNYILGIDLGIVDADALAVLAWSEHNPQTFLVEEMVTTGQGLTELVNQIKLLEKKYDISKMVIDEGGLGKKLAEEMRRQHHIPVVGADKTRKMENIAFLNDAMRTARFQASSKSKFAQDCYLVEIDRDKSTSDKIKVSSAYHSDIIDAVLYAFKESPAFTYQPPKKAPPRGSKEWADSQTDAMFEHELETLQKEQDYNNWINGKYD